MVETNQDFFECLITTLDNIINYHDVDEDLARIYETINDIDFISEDVRKALQLIILYGFKVNEMSNEQMTPDSLGFLLAYLINKLYPEKCLLKILDPLVGYGNLLLSVANHLQHELDLYGIDHQDLPLRIAQKSFNLVNFDIKLYLQDTLSLNINDCDLVLFDVCDKDLSQLCVIKHLDSLKNNGYMLAIIPNDFFDNDTYRKSIIAKANIVGLLELPSDIFNSNNKSILILHKSEVKTKDVLIVRLPSFRSVKEFNKALIKIENWFGKYLGG